MRLSLTSVCTAVLPTLLALSLGIFPATEEVSSSQESPRLSPVSFEQSSSRSFGSPLSISPGIFFSAGSEAACDSQTPYSSQSAECQQTIDLHRMAVFLPVAAASLVFLLSVILVLTLLT